jgi:hypothetical protein
MEVFGEGSPQEFLFRGPERADGGGVGKDDLLIGSEFQNSL